MGAPNLTSNQLTLWVVLLAGLLMAMVMGSAVGSSDMRFIAGVLALVPLCITLINLRTNIWVLIPIGWYVGGRLPFLPIPLTVRDMCMLLPILVFTLFFALRIVPWKRKISALDYLIFINLAYLVTVYVRNPVGAWAFQSQMVGGRPYFEILMAFGAFIILSRATLTPLIARLLPWFFLVPSALLAGLEIASRLAPQLAQPIGYLYAGVAGQGPLESVVSEEAQLGQNRFTSMKEVGVIGVLALCARHSPIKLISPLHPLLCSLLVASFAAIFLSGYRSAFLFVIAALFLSAVLRKRIRDIWMSLGILGLALIAIISVQGTLVQLPMTVQRTLSWLPGDWDDEAVRDAQGSSEWRYEMVAWAWNDNRIIKNKIWGQGFGISIDDMNIIASAMLAGQPGGMFIGGSDRENFMLTGSFHNGPVSTIRYVGVVGFILYYPLLCYLALTAWRLCHRARGTSVFPLSLFIGIPMIYEPFNYMFVFGGFDGNFTQTLFWAGLLNLTNNYLDKITTKPEDGQTTVRLHETGNSEIPGMGGHRTAWVNRQA
ncbi:MAG: O-antigen ligase family protein [Chthoniobacterales bacterium]|nr:O-antigen ligase family protein [Chthoniobacterales bacterium]